MFPGGQPGHGEARLGVVVGELVGERETAHRDGADTPPHPVTNCEHAPDGVLRRDVPGPVHGADVLVLHLRAAFFELAYGHEDAFQNVERFEPGHHDRDAVALRQRLVLRPSHDRTDVAGGQECLHLAVRRVQQRGHRRWDEHVADQNAEVGQAERVGAQHRHGVRRRRRLESDGEEDHLAVGVLDGDADGVQR